MIYTSAIQLSVPQDMWTRRELCIGPRCLGYFCTFGKTCGCSVKNTHSLNLTVREKKNTIEVKKFLRHIFSRLTFEDRVMRIRSEACTFPAVISEDKNERPQCLLWGACDHGPWWLSYAIHSLIERCWILSAGPWAEQAQRKSDKQIIPGIKIWQGQAGT